jgi:hypothetical protein
LQSLINPILKKKADISTVDIQLVCYELSDNKKVGEPVRFVVRNANEVFSKILYQKYRDVSACGILLSRSLAQKYPFPKGKLFEDLFTTHYYYLNVKKVAVISEKLYYYYQRPGSIMGKRNDQFLFDLEESSNLIVKVCQGDPELRKAAKSKRFSNYCRILALIPDLKESHPDMYRKICKTMKKDRWCVLFNSNTRIKNKLAAVSLFFGINVFQRLYQIQANYSR